MVGPSMLGTRLDGQAANYSKQVSRRLTWRNRGVERKEWRLGVGLAKKEMILLPLARLL